MKKRKLRLLASLVLAATSLAANAQSASELAGMTPEERRDYWNGLSEEERHARVKALKAERDSLTPEQLDQWKEVMREQRQLARERWDSMSDEEKQAARDRRRETWDQLSPEEQAAARQQMRKRFSEMSPEERKAARERRREARDDSG